MNIGTSIKSVMFLAILPILSVACSFDNTLYNARKYYASAQSKPLNQNGRASSQAIDDYTKTIKKCGYILTERKNSSQVDDALFLLAQSLYFKGNSIYQAKEQYENLINNFPDSPYIPESTLQLAKIAREINQFKEAESILTDYIRNPRTKKWHPQALLLLADFAIQDKDFAKATFWLEKIRDQYGKSVFAREAAFLLGKNYFEQGEYAKSLEQMSKVARYRSIRQDVRLDARYYIALNQFKMVETELSLTTAQNLLKDEIRTERVSAIQLLVSRILLNMDSEQKALDLLQTIIKNNSKTISSAEAYYRLAEYYYYIKKDVSSAIENYNKVKTESASSPFADDANRKFETLNLIKQGVTANLIKDPRSHVLKQIEIADGFFRVMNQPDSALAIYDSVAAYPEYLRQKADSLSYCRMILQVKADSLSAVKTELQISEKNITDDSIAVTDSIHSFQQSSWKPETALNNAQNDSVFIAGDLNIVQHPDSLGKTVLPAQIAQTDSSKIQAAPSSENISDQIKLLHDEIVVIDNDLIAINQVQNDLQTDLVPLSLFVKAMALHSYALDLKRADEVHQQMISTYPNNKYTLALTAFLKGDPVIPTDLRLQQEQAKLDFALTVLPDNPDSALAVLEELVESDYPEIKVKSIFRLGWYYTFEYPDTLLAKPYLDETIRINPQSDYAKTVKRFYNGKSFTYSQAWDDFSASIIDQVDSLNIENLGTDSDSLSRQDTQSNPAPLEPDKEQSKSPDDLVIDPDLEPEIPGDPRLPDPKWINKPD